MFTHNKQFAQTLYYPDFLFDCGGYKVIVECDEHAHTGYASECERYREDNIRYAADMPCLFIRYNPDCKKHDETHRLSELKTMIDTCIQLPYPPEDSETFYLFYPTRKGS